MARYVLYGIEETQQYTGNRILLTLHWFDSETLLPYETVIDPKYRNYTRCRWDRICEQAEPWGLYENLHRSRGQSKSGTGILDGDTVALLVEPLTLDEISSYIQHKQDHIQRPKNTIHRGLFEIDD